MSYRDSRPQAGLYSRPSDSSHEELLDAVASTGAGTVPLQSNQEQLTKRGDLARVVPRAQKSQLDAPSDQGDPQLSKRAPLTRTDTPRPGAEDEEAEQASETTRKEPKPKSPTHPHASSIELKVETLEQVSPTTSLRQRQIASDGSSNSDDTQHRLKRAQLTRKNLALFNKMGGEKKASATPEPTDSSKPTDDSNTTKTISTTSSDFGMKALVNGMLGPAHSTPPTNIENIRERHAKSRASTSTSRLEYECYINDIRKAPNEASMIAETGAYMLKKHIDKGYNRAFNQPFTGFPKDVGFNNGLSAPQPDFIEGLEVIEYDLFPFNINGAILYKDTPYSLALPHLAGEWKGCGGNMAKATLQSCNDGAALVFARNQALSYLGKPDPLGHAEVTTFTIDGTTVNFYAHYAAPAEDGTLKYHQYQYASANVMATYQEHIYGRRGIRNAQDHAKERSYALRDQLKEHWKQRGDGGLYPIASGAPPPVPDGTIEEMNINEDDASHEIVDEPLQPTLVASSQPHKASRAVPSSESFPPTNDDDAPSGDGHKRRASSPPDAPCKRMNKARGFYVFDEESGQYFHKHSDGRVTWFEDSDDGN
ncbi:hypothetical protein EDB81DRAFT_897503 [Dactylonectria macrodidyma]|uniref:Uncharacterized protein n=1 Tax=Dactylonectria macrodidyma TaxID=307937 RepID=A0A9P9JIV5_9HYPO|nr:hypothetical protein EDB81DRAFT_897503 [Dactylonectria macrodidyma]